MSKFDLDSRIAPARRRAGAEPQSTHRRGPRAVVSALGLFAAATLVISGVGLASAHPAQAAPRVHTVPDVATPAGSPSGPQAGRGEDALAGQADEAPATALEDVQPARLADAPVTMQDGQATDEEPTQSVDPQTASAADPQAAPAADAPAAADAPTPADAPAAAADAPAAFRAAAPQATPAVAAVEDFATTTTFAALTRPTQYGDVLFALASVALDGPANLSGQPIVLEANGVVVAESVLIYTGGGTFSTLIPFVHQFPAGTHSLVARFGGMPNSDPTQPGAAPSASIPFELIIAQIPTTTKITSAPASTRAFSGVDVTAQVTATPGGYDGNAVLLADGSPIMYADLAADGSVRFEDAVVPFGTTELTVAYLGDTAGNYAVSTSAVSPFAVDDVATTTELALSATELRADEEVTFTATVTSDSPVTMTATADSQSAGTGAGSSGAVEFLVDGEALESGAAPIDLDPATGVGAASATLVAGELLLGDHEVTARFVPEPGLRTSASEAAQLRVLGVETTLTVADAELAGTPSKPATVEVTASTVPTQPSAAAVQSRAAGSAAAGSAAAPAAGVDGYVQAFVDDEPLGEPFAVAAGQGAGTLAGLPVGSHEVELRLTPAAQSLLPSATTVSVRVTADARPDVLPDGDTDGGSGDDATPGDGATPRGATPQAPAALSTTGGSGPAALLLGGIALLAGAAGVLFAARRRARH
ncbi:hypothetical protein [Leucobacter luti]|uniref:Gram-positive cocci surface proteins LPxTG domain-containing protein n=1 Tax=Leucobacter luti TaxID=340320 RepID=A0A4Q7U3Q5_9MICO|nr:hypothetical protein [Leucobacter luti]MBL3700787.1 hypothetical protein [Leucobacter luti]RZT68376.1 hypothetical protein EV139_0099 [Leucobacter luti]